MSHLYPVLFWQLAVCLRFSQSTSRFQVHQVHREVCRSITRGVLPCQVSSLKSPTVWSQERVYVITAMRTPQNKHYSHNQHLQLACELQTTLCKHHNERSTHLNEYHNPLCEFHNLASMQSSS